MTTKSKYPYKSPVSGEIAIIASGIRIPGDSDEITKETFSQLRECNFNAAMLSGNIDKPDSKDTMVTFLQYAKGTTTTDASTEEAKIGIIASCYFFTLDEDDAKKGITQAKAFLNFFKEEHTYTNKQGKVVSNNADIIKGWALKDEPRQNQLEETEDGYNLKTIYDYILGNDPQHRPVQINLLGWFDHSEETEKDKYLEYLDTFQNNFDSNLWSYDLYPVTQRSCLVNTTCNQADNCKVNVYHREFYWDLNTFHERSKATGGVFWAYVQSMEFISIDRRLYPAAIEAYIRFEAFSALAFGAQGIVYWTYRQRKNDNGEIYLPALADRNFNRMAAWHYAKRVNYEIKQYSKVFVNSELIRWAHTGESYGGPSIGNGSFGAILSIKASGAGALVTQLKTNGHNYMVIVSHDVEEYQTIDLTFVPTRLYELTPLTSYGEHGKQTHLNTRTIQRQLIPGGYLIYEFIGDAS